MAALTHETRPALTRRATGRLVAGVAGGVADRLGVEVGYVRAALVVLATMWGLGLVVYVALWIATFEKVEDRPARSVPAEKAAGLALMFLGALLALRAMGWWPGDLAVAMVAGLSFGFAALHAQDDLARLLEPERGGPGRLRIVAGLAFLAVGLVILGQSVSQVRTLGPVVLAVGITSIGLVFAFGPWLVKLARDLGTERRERIRQEERAEVAAHLHDSVLQTLALMQRADDPRQMVTLARQQERELRTWLYGSAPTEGTVAAALEGAAARIEADHALPIEVVTVGDASLDVGGRALVAAAAEAMVNAAKHSGADGVSVYLEVSEGRSQVWVGDQGRGFGREDVPPDRRGITGSIVARMERFGGGAEIESRPGEGTEVHLWAPVVPTEAGTRS